jgi:autotransporter-associated beta strand protein
MKPKSTFLSFLIASSSLLALSCAYAADGTWDVDSNGLWSGSGNWASGNIADGSGFTANFTNDITADRTVSLDGDRTLTNLIFDDSDTATAGSWILDNNAVSTNNLILAGTTPTITVNALGTNKTAIISAIIQGTAGLRKSGAGTLILTGANTYTGGTTINTGTLQLGNGGAPASLSTSSAIVNNGNLAFSNNSADFGFSQGTAFASAISGSGSVTLLGGNLAMNVGTNTYNGGFTLAGGRFFVGSNAAALGTGTFTISGGTFSSSFTGAAGQTLTTTNANVWSGNFNLDSRVTGGSMVWNNNGTVLLSGGSRTVTGATAPNLNLGNVVGDGGNNYGLTFITMNAVTLSGANTYGGGTTMGAGILRINNASALGTGKLTISGAMTLDNTTGSAITLSTNNLQDWNADITFTGTRSLDMGTGAVTINANRIVTINNNTFTVGGIGQSGGARSLTKAGLGTLVLTGTSTYTGGTIVNLGTLQIGDGTTAGTMTSTGALTLGGGTFGVRGPASGGSSQTIASLVTTAATNSIIRLTPGASGDTTLTITSNTLTTGAGAGSSVNFNYAAGSTVGGTLGNNYVVWSPTLTGGIIGPAYSVTDSGGTGFATTSGGNVVRLTDPGGAGLPVSVGSATDSYFVASGYSTIDTTTPGSLVEALSGAVAASNVTIDTTGLASGANLALGTNLLTLGAGMAFSGPNPYEITGSGGGGLRAAASAGTIYLNNGNTSTVSINAPILANGASTLTVNGTGTTILGGTNTYTGATVMNGGTVRFSGSMGPGAVTINNAAVAQIGAAAGLSSSNSVTFGANTTGSLQLLGNNVTIGALSANAALGSPVITNNNGGSAVADATLTINSASNVAFAGVIQNGSGGGILSLAKTGAGTYTPTGNNTYTGTTSISGGTLFTTADAQLGSGGTLVATGTATWNMGSNVSLTYNRGLTVSSGTLTLNSGNAAKTVTGVLAGSGAIVGGNSTGYIFTNTGNTFTGAVSNGYQMLFASLGDSSNAVNLTGSNSEFQWTGPAKTFALRPFTLNGTTASTGQAWAGRINNTGSGPLTIQQDLAFSGANGARNLRLDGGSSSGGNTFAGNIADYNVSSVVSVSKAGASTWELTNTSYSYSGGTSVTAGTLGFANGALGSVGTVNASGGTLRWLSSNTQDISSRLAMTAATTSTFDTNGNNVTFATGFGGGTTGALTKSGAGTLLLNGTTTYTGLTTVNAGVLGGTGTIAGSVTVATGGSLAPGPSAGILNIGGGLTVTAMATGTTGKLNFELGANTAASDQIIVTGTLTIGTGVLGFSDFVFSNLGWQNGTYVLMTSGAISGTLDPDLIDRKGPIGAGEGELKISGNNLVLEVTGLGAGSPYDTWASDKGLTGGPGSSTDPAKDADPDKDGRTNLDEFAFDGNPLSGANDGKVVGKIATVGGNQVLTLTLPVRGTAPAPTFGDDGGDQLSALIDGIYYRIEGSPDLSAFTSTITEVTGTDATGIQAGLTALSSGWSYRTFRAPGTVPSTTKAFLRAKISETP